MIRKNKGEKGDESNILRQGASTRSRDNIDMLGIGTMPSDELWFTTSQSTLATGAVEIYFYHP